MKNNLKEPHHLCKVSWSFIAITSSVCLYVRQICYEKFFLEYDRHFNIWKGRVFGRVLQLKTNI